MKGMLLLFACLAVRGMAGMVTCEQLRIDVPEHWERIAHPQPGLFAARTPEGNSLQIALMRLSSPRTSISDGDVQAFKRGLTKKASRVGPERITTVGGRPTLEIDLDASTPEGTVTFFAWIILNGDGLYLVMLDLPDATARQKIINSITFTTSAISAGVPATTSLPEKLGEFTFYLLLAIVVLFGLSRVRRQPNSPIS